MILYPVVMLDRALLLLPIGFALAILVAVVVVCFRHASNTEAGS